MHKLLFLILILSPLILNAAVDESKTDVYFANGVDTTREEARKAMNKVLRPTIEKEIFSGNTAKMDQQIGKFDLLYNETHGLSNDLAEAVLQKISTGNDFMDVFRSYFFGLFSNQVTAIFTREKQVVKISESITSGHKVLVIAHSQGNLFISQVLDSLFIWLEGGGIFFTTPSLSDLIRSSHAAFGDSLVKPEDDVLKGL